MQIYTRTNNWVGSDDVKTFRTKTEILIMMKHENLMTEILKQ